MSDGTPKTRLSVNLIDADDPVSKKDEAITALEKDLAEEKDARKEERFLLFFAVLILLDIFTFPTMQTWSAPVVIGLIQFLVLVALGRKWGMDAIWTITERIIDRWDGKLSK